MGDYVYIYMSVETWCYIYSTTAMKWQLHVRWVIIYSIALNVFVSKWNVRHNPREDNNMEPN